MAVSRADADVLTAEELRQNEDRIRKWFSARLSARQANEGLQVKVARVTLIKPGENGLLSGSSLSTDEQPAKSENTIVGYWCARIAVDATIERADRNGNVDLDCRLFNSKILTVQAVVEAGASPSWTTVSTYAPTLHVPSGM